VEIEIVLKQPIFYYWKVASSTSQIHAFVLTHISSFTSHVKFTPNTVPPRAFCCHCVIPIPNLVAHLFSTLSFHDILLINYDFEIKEGHDRF